MTTKTKAVNLTENEIERLIKYHGFRLNSEVDQDSIERINYLNRRLKSFNDADEKVADAQTGITADTDALNPANQQTKSATQPASKGWGA